MQRHIERRFAVLVAANFLIGMLCTQVARGAGSSVFLDLPVYPALAKKVSFSFVNRPLNEAIAELAKSADTQIEFDTKALADVGISTDSRVTLSLSNISLRSALRILLRSLDLTFTPRDEVLIVTSPDEADKTLFTKAYNVRDLVPSRSGEQLSDYDGLIEVIRSTVMPTSWSWVGGSGNITAYQGMLVVNQTYKVHKEVSDMLAAIRQVRSQSSSASGWAVPVLVGDRMEHGAIRKALESPADFDVKDQPLVEVMAGLQKSRGVPFAFDTRAFTDIGLSTDVRITFKISGVSLGAALNLMLRPLDVTYYIDDEVLWISTPDEANKQFGIRMFNVRDLVTVKNEHGEDEADYDSLIHLITEDVHPTTWDTVGGGGTLTAFEPITSLVCAQTASTQVDVMRLIDDLRAVRAEQANQQPADRTSLPTKQPKWVVKTYFLTVPDSLAAGQPATVKELMQVVKDLVAPFGWGTDQGYIHSVGNSLVVRQTPDVQQKIGKLLKTLRFLAPPKDDAANENRKAA